jgi:glycosyltransferase involved in cell wall biosynthesis
MSAPRARALVTLPDVAVPADSGRRLRSRTTLDGLSRLFDMDVVFLLDQARPAAPPVPSAAPGARWTVLTPTADARGKALVRLAARRLPWTLAHQDWRTTRREILEWVDPAGYDFVWYGAISHCLALAPHVRATSSAVDIDDLESVKWRGYLRGRPATAQEAADYAQRAVELPLWRWTEKRVARGIDAMVLSARGDVDACRRLGIGNTYVVPNTYPDPGRIAHRTPTPPPTLAFVANFVHGPNREAAQVLAMEVLPALRRVASGAVLRLIGRGSEAIAHLAGEPGVALVGAVEEVKPHLEDVTATVMPIRFGGGTRLKVLEAFALGIPVISSAVGVAGLGAVDGVNFLHAETPAENVRCVMRLLDEPELGSALSDAGRRHYEEHFTPQASVERIAELVGDLIGAARSG